VGQGGTLMKSRIEKLGFHWHRCGCSSRDRQATSLHLETQVSPGFEVIWNLGPRRATSWLCDLGQGASAPYPSASQGCGEGCCAVGHTWNPSLLHHCHLSDAMHMHYFTCSSLQKEEGAVTIPEPELNLGLFQLHQQLLL
jgi:hypothetical protein